MKITRYKIVEEFYSKVKYFLEKDEAVNNLALGILSRLVKNENSYGSDKPFLALAEDSDHIVLVMLMTPPYNLQLIGNDSDEIIKRVVEFLKKEDVSTPGLIGRKELCEKFSKEWERSNGVKARTLMDQRIYKLEKVRKVQKICGNLKLAVKEDEEILIKWLMDFNDYIGEEIDFSRAERNIRSLIENKRAFLWVDEVPVSMVLANRATKNGITVSGVYTPQELRGKGYATSCVAKVSQLLLDSGYKFCTLYTDLANPTSNSIYMKIGYEPICDSVMYEFVKE